MPVDPARFPALEWLGLGVREIDPETGGEAAHLKTVECVIDDLRPASVLAARDATIALVRGILVDAVDGDEPLLAPAPAGAAQRIADELLTDRTCRRSGWRRSWACRCGRCTARFTTRARR